MAAAATPSFSIPRRFLAWNAAAFALGFTAFGCLGHAFTGDHDDALKLAQFLGHSAGLVPVCAAISLAHGRALRGDSDGTVVAIAALGAPAAFWLGYYSLGIPFDLLLTFTVLGVAAGIRLCPGNTR